MPDFFFALLLQLVLVVWLREEFDIQIFYVQGKYSVGEEGNLVNLTQHMVGYVFVACANKSLAKARLARRTAVLGGGNRNGVDHHFPVQLFKATRAGRTCANRPAL